MHVWEIRHRGAEGREHFIEALVVEFVIAEHEDRRHRRLLTLQPLRESHRFDVRVAGDDQHVAAYLERRERIGFDVQIRDELELHTRKDSTVE